MPKPDSKIPPKVTISIVPGKSTEYRRRLWVTFWRKLLVPTTDAEKKTPSNQAIAGGEGEHNGY